MSAIGGPARSLAYIALTLSIAVGIVAALAGRGTQAESALRTIRDTVRSQPASGELHIVEIDARSIAAVDRWPWPRGEHARLVDALRGAGARTIAFDVDFSAASTPAGDRAFAASLERAGGAVILPTFRQAAGAATADFVDSLPIAPLREHAFLAAVSILPDRDGFVRQAPFGTITSGRPRPSLSAMLSGQAGEAFDNFTIDYAIEPSTIPRHSFVDVARGGAAAAALTGKDVLIGATAVELGDRYAVPRHGVIPGVVIQALAAETLRNGTPRHFPGIVPLLIAIALALAILRARTPTATWLRGAGGGFVLFVGMGLSEQLFSATAPIAPALLMIATASVLSFFLQRLAERHATARIDDATALPNRLAMAETLAGTPAVQVVTAMIARFDDIASSIGIAGTGQLVTRIAGRLSLANGDCAIYRLEDRVLAWDASVVPLGELADTLDGLRAILLQPIEIGGRRIDARLGLGVASGTAASIAETITASSAAASRALIQGEGWLLADDGAADDADRDLSLMGELDEALARDEVIVHFQPKLDIRTRQIASAEALVRWNHPVRGPISPEIFVTLAERDDRIDGMTLFVIRKTLAALAACAAAGNPVTIAVNISAKLLSSARFDRDVAALLGQQPDLAARLIFEITESAAVANIETAVRAIEGYRALGVAISMDDYGTGQSTLTYIKRLPLAELKIDRSFVQHAHRNRSDAILVRSTIELAHELGLKVVAEGVEDQPCLDFLAASGCDYAQGWLISRPVAMTAFVALLGEGQSLAA